MRTIKFRGKHIKTGEWLYGSHYNDGAEDYILENLPNSALDFEERQIDQNTLGQFTGLQDARGMDIYEGDIMRVPETEFNAEIIGDVRYQKDSFVVFSRNSGTATMLSWVLRKQHETKYFVYPAEILGNIVDNPELIKTKTT